MPIKFKGKKDTDLIVVDRKVLEDVISDIEENLEILESLVGDELVMEAERRMKELKEGKVTPLEEEEIFDLLERD
ncbi:MAG: hypothetical protein KAV80_01950 [Methanomicrobia archaeon]|nr:hypothetical protein [Methanomicrobia archaeon]